ncbi:MAG TPA: CheR family methyltransferase [Planctomycetaceae bacterium]|nr:CheR family methyltransferase [Planctomycetaceae bacterium]
MSDRSSLFVLREPHATGQELKAHYFLQATGARPGLSNSSQGLFQFGVAPHRGSDHPLASAVNQALAPEKSTFFEEVDNLAALITHVLPALIASRRYAQTLRFWSVNCATGQQTYSLAIALAELCPELANWNVEIVASDGDARALERARLGIYAPSEVQRGLPTEWLVCHFEQLPADRGWIFSSQLRERIRWLQLDLSQSCAPVGVADIVIYHRQPDERECDQGLGRALLGRLTDQLASDGFLILPAPDSTFDHRPGWEPVSAAVPNVYRRVKREPSLLSA